MQQEFTNLLASNNIPGGALAVVCGTRVLALGHGVQRQGMAATITNTTRFQMASTTKTMTALTAWRMRQQGLVNLGAPSSDYIPYINTRLPYAQGFTTEQLLAHTAGWTTDDVGSALDLETHMTQNGSAQLWAPPGAVFVYSNPGYALAGLVLQEASSTPFADLVETHLFTPASMPDATMHGATMAAGSYAYGHARSWPPTGTFGPTDSYYSDPWYGPMGGAWLSARDLAALLQVMIGRGAPVLDVEHGAEWTRPRTRTDYPGDSYAQGLFVSGGPAPRMSHGGSVAGFLSRLDAIPDHEFGIAWVINADDAYLSTLADDAITRFTSWEYPACSECIAQNADWEQHVGNYRDDINMGRVNVTGTMGNLQAEFVALGTTRALVPDPWGSRDMYTVDYPPAGGEISVMFWREANDTISYLVSLYGVAARLP